MPSRDTHIGKIILIVLVGLLLGTALGSLIGQLLEPGWVKNIFLASVDAGKYVQPFLNKVIDVFSKFFLRFNIMSIIGILVAYWFNKK